MVSAAELVTTNFAYMAAAVFEGKANIMQLLKVWFFSFFGNVVGSLLVVWLLNEVRACGSSNDITFQPCVWQPGLHLTQAPSASATACSGTGCSCSACMCTQDAA